MLKTLRAIALALVAVALGAVDAGAVKVLVNGDTPSRHYQAIVDRFATPLARHATVTLYLQRCPDAPDRWGCVYDRARPPVIYLHPKVEARAPWTLAHEFGHLFQEWATVEAPPQRFADAYAACALRLRDAVARTCRRIDELAARARERDRLHQEQVESLRKPAPSSAISSAISLR